MQGTQDRQARGARQSQAGQLLSVCLYLVQQLLILRKFANFVENRFHITCRGRAYSCLEQPQGLLYTSTEPLYLFIALFKPSTTNVRAASAARSTISERVFISSREKSCNT